MSGNIKEMGALGNQVVLQAGELETIWESGNERSYILFVSTLLLILESMDPVGSVDSVGSNLIPLDLRIATDPCHVISVWVSWCG